MKRFLTILLLAVAICAAGKDTGALKSRADSLYARHQWTEAAEAYRALLKSDPYNADLHYNYGNACYRLKDIPRAILAYERAARLNPSDGDCRHNLTLARAQTQDKFYSASDLDIAWSFLSVVNTFGADGWGWLSLVALALCLAALLAVRLSRRVGLRRAARTLVVVSVLCIIVFNIFALIQRRKFTDHSSAIVMRTTRLMSTPDTTGTNLFTLHGGTKLSLTDTTLPLWSEVSLSDGQRGWVTNTDIERI